MIGVADINGFVQSTCDIIRRAGTEPSRTGEESDGTVTQERFAKFIEFKLLHVLGDFLKDEPCSIVVMDNASVHMGPEVRELMEGAKAHLFYTATYSPDLNPI